MYLDKIPKDLHFIWVGLKPIHEKYIETLKKLAIICARDGFELNIWVDQNSANTNNDAFQSIESLKVRTVESLLKDILNENGSPYSPEEKLLICKTIAFELLPPANPAAAADFLRIEIIRLHGGTYLDTDINMPGILDSGVGALSRALNLEDFSALFGVGIQGSNNHFISAAPQHSIITECMKTMLEKTNKPYYRAKQLYDEQYRIYENLPKYTT